MQKNGTTCFMRGAVFFRFAGFIELDGTLSCVLRQFRLILSYELVRRGEGLMSSSDLLLSLSQKALQLLQEDADKIEKLIEVQMENLATRKCPLYEEVLDTQMYGLSREIDFAIRAELISEIAGKQIMMKLERNLAQLYEALNEKK